MKTVLKSILITLIFISVLISASCNRNKKTAIEQKNNYKTVDSLNANIENPTLTEFRAFVDSLDSTDATSSLRATEKYKILFTGKSTGLCDTAFVIYQNLLDTLLVYQNENIAIDTTDYESFIKGQKVSRKVSDYLNSMMKKGFLVKSDEGMLYVDINYDFIFVNFLPLVSEQMNLYLTEMQLENSEGFAQNDTIIISPEKHVDRIIWYENFITQYPNFVFIRNCKDYQKAYFTYLLGGFNNSTLYLNNETYEISPYFKKAFEYLLSKYSTSQTSILTQPYYIAIKQKQQAAANEILKKYVIQGLIFNLK